MGYSYEPSPEMGRYSSASGKQEASVRAARKMKGSLLMFLISSEMSSMLRNREKDKFTMITLSPSDSMFLEVTDP